MVQIQPVVAVAYPRSYVEDQSLEDELLVEPFLWQKEGLS
jgi:hypothetical protein